ncbi:Aldehyde/histidinol dehydrogenase [Cristinia sonorae]|uniref:Aldehyde dehydrogenase n=1 Tax=Cristinia sonorae TaxID=1940300 RepID=A0A8K0UNN0_9AGAR|nr:Aldehyde/histidinol dehydrogenase [Cristinia sonorae]
MSTLQYTSLPDIDGIYVCLQTTYKSGKLLQLPYRRKQLYQLAHLIQDNILSIEQALFTDLRKPRQEAGGEASGIIRSSLFAAEHLEEWAAPEKPEVEESRQSWDATIYPVPKGVVLIISPWNYPIVLSLNPLVGAIAAGCPAVIKPSENTPTCSALLATLIPKYLDPEAYIVVNGAAHETSALLTHRWDHIFFTGGGNIGKIIATTAAQKLTPVTLELGGKSPVIVAEDCDLDLAAKRILWGKTQNSGQLCVTADHVYVVRSVASAFREALKIAYATFWPQPVFDSEMAWGKIVNPSHHARLKNLLDRSKGTIIAGGETDGDQRISPTIIANVQPDDSLMEEEIFGPVLPILEVDSTDDAISLIAAQPSPLVIYAFTNSDDLKHKLLQQTRSGSVVFNDIYTQLSVHQLPFGGFAESGHGSYYGKATFDTFTHRRNFVNVQPSSEHLFVHRYRPYSEEGYSAATKHLRVKIPDA